jgi:hypothetical protein
LTNLIGSGSPSADALQYIKPIATTRRFPGCGDPEKLEMLKDLSTEQRRLRSVVDRDR